MRRIAIQIHNHLKEAQTVLVVAHQNPDGDSLGSGSALVEFLLTQGKQASLFCATPPHSSLKFIPHAAAVHQNPDLFRKVDTIVVVDSGDLRYAGVANFIKDANATVINIDHHPTNDNFGSLNLIMPEASSTAEIVYHFFRHNQVTISPRIATALLAGIVTDTDNFSNPATSANALQVASDLLRHGGNLKLINAALLQNKTINLLKLWGVVFSRLAKEEKMNVAHTYLTQADCIEHRVSDTVAEGIANFLNNLDGIKMSLILKETAEGKIKGSFRTTRDDVDVADIAKKLGGGGHKKAAGFSADGTLQDVLRKIISGHAGQEQSKVV